MWQVKDQADCSGATFDVLLSELPEAETHTPVRSLINGVPTNFSMLNQDLKAIDAVLREVKNDIAAGSPLNNSCHRLSRGITHDGEVTDSTGHEA